VILRGRRAKVTAAKLVQPLGMTTNAIGKAKLICALSTPKTVFLLRNRSSSGSWVIFHRFPGAAYLGVDNAAPRQFMNKRS
jgi:hypothetical protein